MVDMQQTANPVAANLPRRNPTLLQRIAARIVRADPAMGPQPEGLETTQTGQPSGGQGDILLTAVDFMKGDRARTAIYKDAEEMDESSEEVSVVFDTIADNLTTSEDGVQNAIEAHSEDARAQASLDKVSPLLKRRLKAICRTAVKYGDFFGEPVFNGDFEVTDLVPLPPGTIYRNEDRYGRLASGAPRYDSEGKCLNEKGECAFEQRNPDTDKIIATFWPWQIVHVRLNHDGFSVYGKSHVRVARLVWRQLKALVEALVIGRLTRDLLKLVFYIDTTGLAPKQKLAVLDQFKKNVSQSNTYSTRRENPFSVLTDFYLSDGYILRNGQAYPMRTKVDILDPKNAGQHNIADIQFIHDKLMMTLRVPKEHIYSSSIQNVQPGILTQKDVQYVRWLRSDQRDIGLGLEQLYNLQLILDGIDPSSTEYTITWPALRATDEAAAAQTELARAQADQIYLQEGVVSRGYLQKSRFGLDDEEIEEIEDQNEEDQQNELDQAQQLADQQHQQDLDAIGAKAKAQGSVHRDVDGQRKGDEGRTRDGKRIAPTKSKRRADGSPSPSGSKVSRSVKATGQIDQASRLLMEFIRPAIELESLSA